MCNDCKSNESLLVIELPELSVEDFDELEKNGYTPAHYIGTPISSHLISGHRMYMRAQIRQGDSVYALIFLEPGP